MAHALAVDGLEKRYGSVQALKGVDLEVGEGELVGLLGPNGAGKSTLVKIAVGLVRATAGRAEVVGATAGSRAARAQLGYLAELFRFPDWYTADEVLGLHQKLAGSAGGADERKRLLELVVLADARDRRVGDMSKGMQQRLGIAQALVGSPRLLLLDEPTSALDPAGRRIARELLELVGLADARDRRVEAMSKGMQQRLGIAQALVGSPPLLLLDEPTSALDPVGRRTVRQLLEELQSRGTSVLLNSHLLSEVELVCDRVVILLRGEVVSEGSPAELSRARGIEIETDEGTQIHEGTREDVPRLVAELVAAGRQVYGVRVLTSTLEDTYLEAVGGETS